MLSRVADSLYWMARNMERAEHTARLISVQLTSQLEYAALRDDGDQSSWRALLRIGSDDIAFAKSQLPTSDQAVLDFLAFGEDNPNSILQCVRIARQNARAVLGLLPSELWQLVNAYYFSMRERQQEALRTETLHDFIQMVTGYSLQFQGAVESSIPHNDAYQFMRIGTFLERAEKMSRVLEVYMRRAAARTDNRDAYEYRHWSAVLQSVSAHESYILKHGAYIDPDKVAEYLLLDPLFPRSIRYSLEQVRSAFLAIEHGHIEDYARSLHIRVGRACAALEYARMEELWPETFLPFVADIRGACGEIGLLLMKTYYLGEIRA
jgi:uncharacterized alpha-E superfamily protein